MSLARTVRAFRLLRSACRSDAAWLTATLRDDRIGFHNTRPTQIALFTDAYRADPEFFLPRPGESFSEARDRIAGAVVGLGPAKMAFALGLIDLFHATVSCPLNPPLGSESIRLIRPLF